MNILASTRRWAAAFAARAARSSFRQLSVALLIALSVGAPLRANAACSGGATLAGWYGVVVSGATVGGVGKYINGPIDFDGACGLTGTVSIGENNSVSSFVNITGSYTTNADGTIAISFTLPGETAPETYDVGYSTLFNEAVGLETDSSAVASFDMKPQNYPASGAHGVYSNASLQGGFVAACAGISGTYSDLNVFTFDGTTGAGGLGNITGGIDDFNNFAQFGDEPYIGQYSVGANGNFGGTVTINGSLQFGLTGVIDNALNEIQYVYSNAGSPGSSVALCTGKRILALQGGGGGGGGFSCHVGYTITGQFPFFFSGGLTIGNTSNTAISSWKVTWTYANGQKLTSVKNAGASQNGASVALTNLSYNGTIPAGGSYTGVSFAGLWNNVSNATPTSFAVNGTTCN